MKIFFRYLFVRLLVPFLIVFCACALIWIMVDLYGNINDFIEHKTGFKKILYFYALQVPGIVVQVLPASLLFSTLWTLLNLNRRSELVAFLSGGMSPIWLFSPFFLFAAICVLVLGVDLSGPAAYAQVTRERVLLQVKGQDAKSNVFRNLAYVDRVNQRTWFFQSLDTNQNSAKGLAIVQRDADGHDLYQYIANNAKWSNGTWRLSGVKEIIYAPDGSAQDQKIFEEKDLDITTPPGQMSLIISQPEQLSVPELSSYIATSTSSRAQLAKYRTEWWDRLIHPLGLLALVLYALVLGTRTDRRSNAGVAVGSAIIVLVLYWVFRSIFLTAGVNDRLPPYVAVMATEFIFGAVGLQLLAVNLGWWSSLWEYRQQWRAPRPVARNVEV